MNLTVKDAGAECNVLPIHLMIKTKLKESRTSNLISYIDDKVAVLGQAE